MSDVLKKALSSPMREATERVIQIKEFHPAAVVAMVRFCYGEGPNFSSMEDAILHDLVRAAHM